MTPDVVSPARNDQRAGVEPPLLISVPQTARLLGIGATLAWTLVHAGVIPSVKLGRRVLVPRAAAEQLAHPATSPSLHAPGQVSSGWSP